MHTYSTDVTRSRPKSKITQKCRRIRVPLYLVAPSQNRENGSSSANTAEFEFKSPEQPTTPLQAHNP